MFCPNCGKQINDGDAFCAYCRYSISGNAPVTDHLNTMPQAAPAAEKKTSPAMMFLCEVLVCAAVTGAVLLFIKPGYMLKKGDDSAVSSTGNTESPKAEEKTSVVTTTGKAAETSVQPVTETSEPTTTVTTTSESAETPTETASASTEPEPAETVKTSGISSFSTYEKPSFGDFEWCYGQFGLVRDPPDSCEFLTDPALWAGGWKCLIVYTVADNAETIIREINNVDIGVDGTSLTLKMKHHIYEINGESYDDSVTADFDFWGEVYQGMFDAAGVGRVTMTCFWRKDGHEYAVGDYLLLDGSEVYIAFMR